MSKSNSYYVKKFESQVYDDIIFFLLKNLYNSIEKSKISNQKQQRGKKQLKI